MPKYIYSKDQRAKIVESYFSRNGSLVAVHRDFVRTFNQLTKAFQALHYCNDFKIQRFRLNSRQRTLWHIEFDTKYMYNSTCFIECCSGFENVD